MEEIGKNVAANLKELRKRRQLTLEELAERSAVSRSMLGEIERGRATPTITVLWKIAQALKTPLTTLIGNREDSFTVVRATDRVPFNEEAGHAITSIFPYYEPHRLEALAIDLAPGAALDNAGHMKGVEEYLFVLEGAIEVTVQREKIGLRARDSIRFAADTAHRIENVAAGAARLLNIIYYR
ncbi:helix-turn-helix domain-containing protein [Anaeroselena agilis]|uniref:XRE family transcriptional regulator n=1 Tax=Anaeroselena agilis TaxID=3063788 RepID=A0ABU3P2H4_9FIRM|nr:XRE family transcriptional regulator [Selenomonadales bacterium 4137-cl]